MTISNFRDIDLTLLLRKIKESDFLLGKAETKPNINHFSVKNMIERILADAYKNKETINVESLNPAHCQYQPKKREDYTEDDGIFRFFEDEVE